MAIGAQQAIGTPASTREPPAAAAQARGAWWGRYLLSPLANLLRIGVRCAFPLLSIAVLALLLWCDQGRDVLRTTLERAAGRGRSINDLAFLMAGSALLALSVWYSMRWLLSAQMRSLPLPQGPSLVRNWLPRLTGAAAPALVAFALYGRRQDAAGDYASIAIHWAGGFAALTLALLAFFVLRGRLMVWMRTHGWLATAQGRAGAAPGDLGEHDPIPRITLGIVVWSVAFTFGIFALFVAFPVTAPRVPGTTGVAVLSLASINLFGSFALSYWPLRSGVPHLAPWAVLAAGVIGAFNDNHVVQPAPLGGDALPPVRTPPLAALEAWAQAHGHAGAAPLPVLVVASEGGGIRAAYWTAAVLTELARQVPQLDKHLFALSGVSGGSLGVAAYVATRSDTACIVAAAAGPPSVPPAAKPGPTQALGADFLAPAVGGLMFQDLAQRFIPWPIPAFDRSRGLEQGWQRAFAHLRTQPFERPMHALYQDCPGLPRLLLNATVVETGQRAVLTDLDPRGFVDTLDVMGPESSASRQSLAGLVHHSARFPVLSPAGTLERRLGEQKAVSWRRLVDGGYFDNSGTQTAMELIRELTPSGNEAGNTRARAIRPVLLVVRNDAKALAYCGPATAEQACPLPGGVPTAAAQQARAAIVAAMQAEPPPSPVRLFPETRAPVEALFNARAAHARPATLAARSELTQRGGAFIELAVLPSPDALVAPLGWSLSKSTRDLLDRQARERALALKPVLTALLQGRPATEAAIDCAVAATNAAANQESPPCPR